MSVDFYKNLPEFTSFEEFSNADLYAVAPSDWFVVITDVKGSTKAIENGRYQDVNTIGVAAITALQNILPASDFPFVFGGDGMSALLPSTVMDSVQKELSALRLLSETQFKFDLRVGIVPMTTIERHGGTISIAKYKMGNGQCLAMFTGGGLSLAEDLIKGNIEQYGVPKMEQTHVNLERLSCRWHPIPASNDVVLSILIQALPDTHTPPQTRYQQFSTELTKILGSVQKHNPVNYTQMQQKTLKEAHQSTARINPKNWKMLLISWFVSLWYLIPWIRNMNKLVTYGHSMTEHSDYWKFDDMLRMILDCTTAQQKAIEQLCHEWKSKGWIVYGIHLSDSALITCQFDSFDDGKHMHFIDGGNGGYAMAAKTLKSQLKEG